MKTCLNCKTQLNENSQSYVTLCKSCYIDMKRREKYNKCDKCDKYNLNKTSEYETCYTCNITKHKKKCGVCEEYKLKKDSQYPNCYECSQAEWIKNKNPRLDKYAFTTE